MKKIIISSLAVVMLCLSVNAATLAYWRFEEGPNDSTHVDNLDGYYVDSSGNGNNLSSWYFPAPVPNVPIATIPLSGVTNKIALDFCKRRNDKPVPMYIATSAGKAINSYDLTGGFTIECAMKTFMGGWNAAINKEGKPTAAGNSPFKLFFRLSSPYVISCEYLDAAGNVRQLNSSFEYELNKWYWVAVVSDGTDAKLYIKEESDANYELEATIAGASGIIDSSDIWNIGCGTWNDGDLHDLLYGSVDEVRICDSALDTDQFIAASGGSSVSPIAYWRFEEGIDGVHQSNNDDYYVDSSGNGNDMSTDIIPTLSRATNDVPFATVPQTGAANTMARLFTASPQNIGTFAKQTGGNVVDTYDYSGDFTVETMIKSFDTAWNVIVGRDGEPDFPTQRHPPFTIQSQADSTLQAKIMDSTKAVTTLHSSFNHAADVWYRIAYVCQGGTNVKLYIAQEGETSYDLEDEATIVGGMIGGNFPWTVGRGMYDGDIRDGVNGIVDEVRISDSALLPSQFLGVVPEPGMILGGIALALLALRRK